jgi:hypothetical protein
VSGGHGGTAPGAITPQRSFYEADAKYYAQYPNVTVKDITTLSPTQIQALKQGPEP